MQIGGPLSRTATTQLLCWSVAAAADGGGGRGVLGPAADVLVVPPDGGGILNSPPMLEMRRKLDWRLLGRSVGGSSASLRLESLSLSLRCQGCLSSRACDNAKIPHSPPPAADHRSFWSCWSRSGPGWRGSSDQNALRGAKIASLFAPS